MVLLAMEKYVRQNVQVCTKVIPIIETKKTQVSFRTRYGVISYEGNLSVLTLIFLKTIKFRLEHFPWKKW